MLKLPFRSLFALLLIAQPAFASGVTTVSVPTTTQNTAAPATPSSGQTAIWADATNKNLEAKNDAGVVSETVQVISAVAHKFLTAINADGSETAAQPACADLSNGAPSCSTDATNAANISSGTLPAGRLPNPSASTLGGTQSAAPVSHQFVTGISTAGVPAQAQPAASDVSGLAASATTDTTNAANISSGTLPAARLPNPSASTLGGTQSAAPVSHQFVTGISTAGVPGQAQPAASDVSGLAASATTDTTNAANISSGTLPAARLPTPGASTLGGVESGTCAAHQYVNQLNTSGVHVCGQPAIGDLSANPMYCPSGYQSGPYYGIPNTHTFQTGTTLSANQLYGEPVCFGSAQTFTKESLDFVTGSAGNCELAIYSDNGSNMPGNLLADAGNISSAGTGIVESTGQTLTVAAGHYWLAWGCNSTPALETFTSNVYCVQLGASGFTSCYTGVRGAWTYSAGNPPNPFPSPALVTGNFGMAAVRF